jgi:hypothetical protein
MSLQDGKDTSVQFSNLSLSNLNGVSGLSLKNKNNDLGKSIIYQDNDKILVIKNEYNKDLGPSDVVFVLNDDAGDEKIPLIISGDGIAIEGECLLNGVPIGTGGGSQNIEQVLTTGSNAGGQSITGLLNVNSTGRIDVANGAGNTQGLYLGGVRAIFPYVANITDIPSTDPFLPILFSTSEELLVSLPNFPAGVYYANAIVRIVGLNPFNRYKLRMFAGAGETDNFFSEAVFKLDSLNEYTIACSGIVILNGSENFTLNLLVDDFAHTAGQYLIDSPSFCELIYITRYV